MFSVALGAYSAALLYDGTAQDVILLGGAATYAVSSLALWRRVPLLDGKARCAGLIALAAVLARRRDFASALGIAALARVGDLALALVESQLARPLPR